MSAIGEINTLKAAYDCNLATFKEYYVLTKMYPQDDSYLQKFTDAKNNMIQLSKSLFLLNCLGFTKIETKVLNLDFFDCLINEICPLCNPPIVGTNDIPLVFEISF